MEHRSAAASEALAEKVS